MKLPETKRDYLDQLNRALLWNQTRREAGEVLRDYEGFFQAGLAEGGTEAELCRRFGPPESVARALAREWGAAVRFRRPSLSMVLRLLATAAMFLLLFSMTVRRFEFANGGLRSITFFTFWEASWILPICAALGLWFIWHKGYLSAGTLKRSTVCACLIPLCIWLLGYLAILYLVNETVRLNYLNHMKALILVPIVYNLQVFIIMLELLLLVLNLYLGLRHSAFSLLGTVLSFGVCISLLGLRDGLRSISDISQAFHILYIQPLLPIAAALLGAGFLALLLRKGGDRRIGRAA